jgi:hypothetical protein
MAAALPTSPFDSLPDELIVKIAEYLGSNINTSILQYLILHNRWEKTCVLIIDGSIVLRILYRGGLKNSLRVRNYLL